MCGLFQVWPSGSGRFFGKSNVRSDLATPVPRPSCRHAVRRAVGEEHDDRGGSTACPTAPSAARPIRDTAPRPCSCCRRARWTARRSSACSCRSRGSTASASSTCAPLPKVSSAIRSCAASKALMKWSRAASRTVGHCEPIELETSRISDRSTIRRVASPVLATFMLVKFAEPHERRRQHGGGVHRDRVHAATRRRS